MPPLPEDEDVRAMQRLKDGDDLALNAIMERWQLPLSRFLLRFLDNERDALDLTQETFVRVYLNRERYRPTGRFSTWLYAIATNLARQHLRWRRRHPEVSTTLDDSSPDGESPPGLTATDTSATPAEASINQEQIQAVRRAIQALPPDLREALILHQYEALPHAAIAEVLSCSPKAVETRLYRARNKLRQSLARYLGPENETLPKP